ncbi:MAG TPA: Holliday junction resolvase RuvX [Actinomycetota bacterium]
MTQPGCVLGLDPGERRMGVAAADLETRFARPVEVVDVSTTDPVERTAALVAEMGAELVVVGRPVGLSGAAGAAVDAQQMLVERLRARLDVPVEEYDERLTTVVAEQGLRAAGATRRARKETRDAIAAQVMLQGYMDAHR